MYVDEIQYGFMPEIGTIVAVFIVRMLDVYHAKVKKLHMSFVDLEKDFYRVLSKVLEWAMWKPMRKKGIPKLLVKSVMSLYEGAKTRVRVDSELSEEFDVRVGLHQGSVLSPFFALVVDVVTEFARVHRVTVC